MERCLEFGKWVCGIFLGVFEGFLLMEAGVFSFWWSSWLLGWSFLKDWMVEDVGRYMCGSKIKVW